MTHLLRLAAVVVLMVVQSGLAQERGTPWPRHVIHAGTRGADGVRLADANGDGLMDVCTAFEEGGQVKVFINPGPDKARDAWSTVVVGSEADGEDAVFYDVDGDGAMDVVSCHEGKTRSVLVHWAPTDKRKYLDATAWVTEPFPMLSGKQMWMFCQPVDGGLVLGSKGRKGGTGKEVANEGTIGLLQPPPGDRRDLSKWRWTQWSDAGWIMSIQSIDVNRDGREDVLVSDRYGPRTGVAWYENPADGAAAWTQHEVVNMDVEALFITPAVLEENELDVVVATRQAIHWYKMDGRLRDTIPVPDWTGSGKAVSVGDIDGDSHPDIVFTCEHAQADKSGIAWAMRGSSGWTIRDIGGPSGIKYDLCPLIDLDNDGDLDVLTTEEREGGKEGGLGVVWYENPAK